MQQGLSFPRMPYSTHLVILGLPGATVSVSVTTDVVNDYFILGKRAIFQSKRSHRHL